MARPRPAPLPDEATAPARLGATAAADEAAPPELTRRGADAPAPDSTPLLRDAGGAVLARWRATGVGRVGVWTVADSSGLVTAGFGDRYGELWGALFAALARPAGPAAERLPDRAVAGRRTVVCGVRDGAVVAGGGEAAAPLLVDPASGTARCAGYWPTTAGWRTILTSGAAGPGAAALFYVAPAGQAPGLAAEEDRVATSALVGDVATPPGPALREPSRTGPSWPWLLAWLVVAGAVWRLERSQLGRRAPPA